MPPTALIVPTPAAERATQRWRRRYTQDGVEGMPPHVTLLYPFLADEALRAEHLRALRAVLAAFQPFDFVLGEFAEFPASATSPSVLYLAPKPADRFRDITTAIVARFPDHPPYGGRFPTIIPHLTVAEDAGAPLAEIRAEIEPTLPIRARAAEAHLMLYGSRGWRLHTSVHLVNHAPGRRGQPLST